MKYIAQREDWDCAVAGLAMATDRGYDYCRTILEPLAFQREGKLTGLNEEHIVDFLANHGYAYQKRSNMLLAEGGKLVKRNWWPLQPWAPMHVAQVEATAGWHFVAMDAAGVVHDPFNEKRHTLTHEDYKRVAWIMGIWKVS